MDNKNFEHAFSDLEKGLLDAENKAGINPLELFMMEAIAKKKKEKEDNAKFRDN